MSVSARKSSQSQRKPSRVGSTASAAPTTRAVSIAQPTRANSIATMPSSSAKQSNRNGGSTTCGCGSAGHNQVKTEVWDPFQFDCMTPGSRVSAKDLLHTINEQRQTQQCGNSTCRPNPCRPPPPRPLHPPCCDTGESDSSGSDNGRRTAEFLYDMWCQQKLCDVVLCCTGDCGKDDSILAHKVVLAAYSEYLVQKFCDFPASEVVSIDLTQYPPIAVFSVLRFVYTGELELTRDTVGCIWKVAEDLGICTIVGLCEDYLGQPSVDSAIFHYAVAERFGLTQLGCRIYQFICDNFMEVSETCEFMFLPAERICELLSDDRICVTDELDVFCAFIRWVEHDRENRICQAAHLLQDAVRLHCIHPQCIVCNIETVDWLFDAAPECQVVTNEAMRYHALALSGSTLAQNYPEQLPRCCLRNN